MVLRGTSMVCQFLLVALITFLMFEIFGTFQALFFESRGCFVRILL